MTQGLVDLHLHIIPQVDDGSTCMEDSVQMARVLHQFGFTELAPSPHHQSHFAPKDVADRGQVQLQAELEKNNLHFIFHSNAENAFYADGFFGDIASGNVRTLGAGTPYILVECPHHAPFPGLIDAVFRLKLKGWTPLIAHPERCLEFHKPKKAKEVVDAGALLQMDIGALVGRYGPQAKKLAYSFLGEGLYLVAATDMHGPKNAEVWLNDSLEALRLETGDAVFHQLLAHNPRALLRGEKVLG